MKKNIIVFIIFSFISIIFANLWLLEDSLYISEEFWFGNYGIILDKVGFNVWNSNINNGSPAAWWDIITLINSIFYFLLSKINVNHFTAEKLILVSYIFLILFSIYLLLNLLIRDKKLSFILSFFYLFNYLFFTSVFYTAKMSQLILMPLISYLILKIIYSTEKYLLILCLVLFTVGISIWTNLPQAISTYVAIFSLITVYVLTYKNDLKLYYLTHIFILFLVSLIIPILVHYIYIYYGENFAVLKSAASFNALYSNIVDILQFRGQWGERIGYDGVEYNTQLPFYDSYLVITFSFLLLIISVIVFFTKTKLERKDRNLTLFFFALFLFFIFLSAGTKFPFVYNFIFDHIPFFYIFREPWAKFIPIALFFFTIVLAFSVKNILNLLNPKYQKVFLIFIVIIIFGKGYNFFSTDFFDHRNLKWKKSDVKPPVYWENLRLYSMIHKDKRVFIVPVSKSHTYWYYNWKKPYKTWSSDLSGIYLYFDKLSPFHFSGNPLEKYFNNRLFENPQNLKVLNFDFVISENDLILNRNSKLYGINKLKAEGIVYRKPFKTFGQVEIYRTNRDFFLPHLYTPKNIIIANQSIHSISQIVSQPDYKVRSAIFLKPQNIGKKLSILNNPNVSKTPIVEYRKINSTKYKVILHQASGQFPIVFNENHHRGWKAYFVNQEPKNNLVASMLKTYKIIEGNEYAQASKQEVAEFITKAWVSSLGNGEEKEIFHNKWVNDREVVDHIERYSIEFISKNFKDTIQNDNLPSGHFYDTWFKNALPENYHFMANGYANAWLIDLDMIAKKFPSALKQNKDGSYDVELIIEYWPQRLFDVSYIMLGLTLIGLIGYLSFRRFNSVWRWSK